MPCIAGRKSTLFFITFLSVLSFTVLLAESADVHGRRGISRHGRTIFGSFPVAHALGALPPPANNGSGMSPSTSLTSSTVVSLPSSAPTALQPPVSSSIVQLQTSYMPVPSIDGAILPPSIPAASSSAPASASGVMASASASSSASVTTLISAVSSSSTGSTLHVQVSAPSSSPAVAGNSAPPTPPPSAGVGGPGGGIPSMTPIVSSPSSTSSDSPSSSSFFSNKGAVAGTFTVVGLVGVAGIIGAGMIIARRRSSSRGGYDEDMEYLEKEREPDMHVPRSHSPDGGFTDMDHTGLRHSSSDLQRPPEAHLYPDHGVHMGYAHSTPMDDDPSYYGQDATLYSPNTYGIEYPPGEAYGAPHQPTEAYRGGPNPQVEGYGNVTTQFQQAEYGGTFTHQADARGEMSNPHEPYLYPEPAAVAQPAAAAVPSALRPSVKHKSVMNPFLQSPEQRDPHTSIDSFYGGIVQGNAEPAAF